MSYQYPTTTNPLYRSQDAVLASEWTAGGTGATKISPVWGGVGCNGSTVNRLAWVSRAIDVDGAVDWLWSIETVPPIAIAGTADRAGPGLVDAAGTNIKHWVFASNGTQLYIGTEVATVPTYTLVGAYTGVTGYHNVKRGRITVVAGVIGAGARACDFYISVDDVTNVLMDSDTIDASAVCIGAQGIVAATARIQILLLTEKKVT